MAATTDALDQLLDLVKQQQAFLEMFVRSWVTEYRAGGGTIYCGKGCSNCCSLAVHTGFAEALAVAGHLDDEQERAVTAYALKLKDLVRGISELPDYLRLHRKEIAHCPLLDASGACSAYGVRPLSCRSLISTRESVWCGTDFSRLAPEERDAFLAGLDRNVVAFPSHYVAVLQESGQELEQAGAQAMRRQLGFSLYGNLGVLVHLIRRHGLAQSCLEGEEAVTRTLAQAGFAQPYLVTLG